MTTAMNLEEHNKSLVRRLYDETNKADIAILDELFSEELVNHQAGVTDISGDVWPLQNCLVASSIARWPKGKRRFSSLYRRKHGTRATSWTKSSPHRTKSRFDAHSNEASRSPQEPAGWISSFYERLVT